MRGHELIEKLRNKKASYWQKVGEKSALSTFRYVSETVPAYKDFLKKNKIKPSSIKNINDFVKLPLTDKENYVSKYELKDLCPNGHIEKGTVIAQSSGTSGLPFFWARFKEQEKESDLLHYLIFKEFYKAHKVPTLFVVCFHLGSHIAGYLTTATINRLLNDGFPGALCTPGLNKADILRIVKSLAGNFKQVVMVGYPPFLRDVVVEGKEMGIDWKKINTRFMFSAESFPENWRSYMNYQVGLEHDEFSGLNIYGSADLGFMGHETPLSVMLRRKIFDKKIFELFGELEYVPPLYQYHPWSKYFEEVNGELVCTAKTGMPFVRYAIKDRGKIISFSEAQKIIGGRVQGWQLPFVAVKGRSNYAVTLYGLNIYPEHVQHVLTKKEVMPLISGKFFLKNVYNDNGEQALEIHIELSESHNTVTHLIDIFKSHIVDGMKILNSEYNKLTAAIGKKAEPIIILYSLNSEEFKNLKAKYKYIVK